MSDVVYGMFDTIALHDSNPFEIRALLASLGVRTFMWSGSEESVYYFPFDNDATTGAVGEDSLEQFTDVDEFIERVKELQLIYRG